MASVSMYGSGVIGAVVSMYGTCGQVDGMLELRSGSGVRLPLLVISRNVEQSSHSMLLLSTQQY